MVTVSSSTVPMTRPEVHNGAGLVAFGWLLRLDLGGSLEEASSANSPKWIRSSGGGRGGPVKFGRK